MKICNLYNFKSFALYIKNYTHFYSVLRKGFAQKFDVKRNTMKKHYKQIFQKITT